MIKDARIGKVKLCWASMDIMGNKLWDKEYATSFYNEVLFLRKK